MKTYNFVVHLSGDVRIDAESEEEAKDEFEATFAHEAVLVTARQDQIMVIAGTAWEEPTEYVDPDNRPDEGEEENDGQEV